MILIIRISFGEIDRMNHINVWLLSACFWSFQSQRWGCWTTQTINGTFYYYKSLADTIQSISVERRRRIKSEMIEVADEKERWTKDISSLCPVVSRSSTKGCNLRANRETTITTTESSAAASNGPFVCLSLSYCPFVVNLLALSIDRPRCGKRRCISVKSSKHEVQENYLQICELDSNILIYGQGL